MTPQEEALKYLEKHRMIKLFDFLGAKIASQQPDDVNGFLKEEIQRIIEAKANGKKYTIFDEVDVNALFASFDITQRGYLTQLQYEKGKLPYVYQKDHSMFAY